MDWQLFRGWQLAMWKTGSDEKRRRFQGLIREISFNEQGGLIFEFEWFLRHQGNAWVRDADHGKTKPYRRWETDINKEDNIDDYDAGSKIIFYQKMELMLVPPGHELFLSGDALLWL